MTELGKSAKRMGHQHPSVLRRTDPVPMRPTPKAKPQRKPDKFYGYEYEWGGKWMIGRHRQRAVWFKTAGQRDQAMADFEKKWRGKEILSLIGPINRGPTPTPGEKHGE